MTFNNFIKKTALAAAIATVSFGASAAGTLTIATPAVLANDIFGTASETTLASLPNMSFVSTTLNSSVPNVSTIKLTLGGDVIFGEVYDNPANWLAQGIAIVVDGSILNGTTASVTAGGTSNDNQITIQLKAPLGVRNLKNPITLTGLKVKQLTSELAPGKNGEVTVAIEVRADVLGNTSASIDTSGAEVAIKSIDGVVLTAAQSDYSLGGDRARINVTDKQKNFTVLTGAAAADSFVAGQNFIDFGTLTIARNTLVAIPAKKEDGTLFDFVGADKISLNLVGSNDLSGFGQFFLSSNTSCAATLPAEKLATGTPGAGAKTVAVKFTNAPVLGQTLQLCAEATGTKVIEQQTAVTATLDVDYFSSRYVDFTRNASYGAVLRNGCQVTLFNLPNVNAADNAFIRFTNTSDKSGEVNATVWSEAGVRLDSGSLISANLDAHATTVFHTNKGQTTGVYLGDVLPEFAASTGRSRIVLEGAFANCEALGLVRSANGTLVNMTSTVYSGGKNGTSNTTN